MFPNYKTEKNAKKWIKITKDGETASTFSPREHKDTDKDGDTVALLNYGEWNPDLYGGCEM